MDEETRIAALKKLSSMKRVIAYFDEYMNDSLIEKYYNNLEILSDQYLQNLMNFGVIYKSHAISRLREAITEKSDWTDAHITVVNAFYFWKLNKIGN